MTEWLEGRVKLSNLIFDRSQKKMPLNDITCLGLRDNLSLMLIFDSLPLPMRYTRQFRSPRLKLLTLQKLLLTRVLTLILLQIANKIRTLLEF